MRRVLLLISGAALVVVGMGLAAAPSAGTSVSAAGLGFGHNVRVDLSLGPNGDGDNEPALTVDQTGTTYVNWQKAALQTSPVTKTVDGVHFSPTVEPDPNGATRVSQFGDVAWASTTWPRVGVNTPITVRGQSAVFHTQLGQGLCGPIQIRVAPSLDQGRTWAPQDATCQVAQVDRPWVAAYTPPQYRGTADAVAHTRLYTEHHDFGISNIWVTSSADGGASWNRVLVNAEQPGSAAQLTSLCNTIPGGIAVDQRGAHPGRVYAVWEASDTFYSLQGCNITQAQPFDHIFVSYSDDGGSTWTSSTVYNDICSPNPPIPTTSAATCQDISELFSSIAVDDAGNVYVAFISRGQGRGTPEYDAYVSVSSDGGAHWNGSTTASAGAPHKVNTTTGTHYMPWIAAGQDGAIDIAFYRTAEVAQPSTINNKPQQTSPAAVWQVFMAQSFDHGNTFTQAQVSDAPFGIYFGDICSTGIFCGNAPPTSNWAQDRTLYERLWGGHRAGRGRPPGLDRRTRHHEARLPARTDVRPNMRGRRRRVDPRLLRLPDPGPDPLRDGAERVLPDRGQLARLRVAQSCAAPQHRNPTAAAAGAAAAARADRPRGSRRRRGWLESLRAVEQTHVVVPVAKKERRPAGTGAFHRLGSALLRNAEGTANPS